MYFFVFFTKPMLIEGNHPYVNYNEKNGFFQFVCRPNIYELSKYKP